MYIILFLVIPLMIYYIVRDAAAKGVYDSLKKYEEDKTIKYK